MSKTVGGATKYFVDVAGVYLGAFGAYVDPETGDDVFPPFPVGAIEVPEAPEDARQTWNGAMWSQVPAPPPPPLTADALADLLVSKGVVTRGEVDAKRGPPL